MGHTSKTQEGVAKTTSNMRTLPQTKNPLHKGGKTGGKPTLTKKNYGKFGLTVSKMRSRPQKLNPLHKK